MANITNNLRGLLVEILTCKKAMAESVDAMRNFRDANVGQFKAVSAKRHDPDKDKSVTFNLEYVTDLVTDAMELAIASGVQNKVFDSGETVLQVITSTLIEYRVYSRMKNRSTKEVSYGRATTKLAEARTEEEKVVTRYYGEGRK